MPKITKIESCGLDVTQPMASPQSAIEIAREFGVDLTVNRSKNISEIDTDGADIIIVTEYTHYQQLSRSHPDKIQHIYLLRSFFPWPASLVSDIHDPFGCNDKDFRRCFRTMKDALDAMAETLR
ncbi:hypothetical protein LA52FAK_45830 [Desulforhopalus sp. 52FAK]